MRSEEVNMKNRKLISIVLVMFVIIGCFCINVSAADINSLNVTRATGQFNLIVEPGKISRANTSFQLESGETVTINATYSPSSSSVAFGLIDEDGRFYSLYGTDGSFNRTFSISERGYYTFAIQNNSSVVVSVSGFINY